MVHTVITAPVNQEDPRGSIEHSPITPPDSSRVNTARRHTNHVMASQSVMASQFESQYSNLQSHLTAIKAHVISQNDVISQFLTATTSDQLFSLSSKAMESHLEIESTMDDYKEAIKSIEKDIEKIEDEEEKRTEKTLFTSRMAGTDGATQLSFDEVSLTSLLSKLDKKYNRAFESATLKVATLARLPPNHSDQSTLLSSINHSVPSIQSPLAVSHDDIQSQSGNDPPTLTQLQMEIQSLKRQIISSSQSNTQSAQTQIPLPPLRLEPFDGSNITLWPSFHSQFHSIIGCRHELSDLEKLNYLRSSLKGDALRLVQSIPIREDLYEPTLDRLKVAYDRSNHSIALLYQKLMALKPKSSSIEDQLNCVRDMINMAYHIDDSKNLDSLPLIQQLAGRVNSNFVRKIWKLAPSTMMDALVFMDRDLREELEYRAVENAFAPSHQSTTHQSSIDSPRDRHSVREQNSRPPKESHTSSPKCEYCASDHLAVDCSKFKSLDERSNRISQMKLCRKCLKPDHNFTQCPIKCGQCNGIHHKSICKSPSSPQSTFHVLPVKAEPVKAVNQPSFTHPRLQTVNGIIRDPIQGMAVNATVFLDTGSQLSIITQSLTEKLNLKPVDSRVLRLTGVNGSTNHEPRDFVQFDLMTNTGVQSVTAMVADKLPVPPMRVDAIPQCDVTFIEQKAITVPSINTTHHLIVPEILLGVDTTHSITKNSCSIKLPSGLDLIQSQLGPIIFGSKSQNDYESIPVQYDSDTLQSSTLQYDSDAVCFGVIIDPDDHEAQAERDDRLDRIARLLFNVDGSSEYDDDDNSLSFDESFSNDHAHLIPSHFPDYFPP